MDETSRFQLMMEERDYELVQAIKSLYVTNTIEEDLKGLPLVLRKRYMISKKFI